MIPVSGSAYTYSYATMGENRRLDHRLGSDSRVCGRQHGCRRRLVLGIFVRLCGERADTLAISGRNQIFPAFGWSMMLGLRVTLSRAAEMH